MQGWNVRERTGVYTVACRAEAKGLNNCRKNGEREGNTEKEDLRGGGEKSNLFLAGLLPFY